MDRPNESTEAVIDGIRAESVHSMANARRVAPLHPMRGKLQEQSGPGMLAQQKTQVFDQFTPSPRS
jgi:hypothetical protein